MPAHLAAQAIDVDVLVNCVMKAGIAGVLDAPEFRRLTTPVIAAITVAIAVVLTMAV